MSQENENKTHLVKTDEDESSNQVVLSDPHVVVETALNDLRPLFTRIADECSKIKIGQSLSISNLTITLAKEHDLTTKEGTPDSPRMYNLIRPMLKALEDSGDWETKRGPKGGIVRKR